MNARSSTFSDFSAAGSENAAAIAVLFAREIGRKVVGIDENFFDLGIDSLAAENLIIAVQEHFDIRLQTSVLLEASTSRALALKIEGRWARASRSLVIPLSGSASGEAMVMIHGMSGSALFAHRFGPQLRERFALHAIRGMGLEPGESPFTTVQEITQSYFQNIFSATGRTPLIIGGLCLGGLLAIEVGRLSHAATGEVPSLILIDPPPRGSAWLRPALDNRITKRRRRQLDRQVRLWNGLHDFSVSLGLGQLVEGKARREAFKKTLTRAVAGFAPEPYPCSILIIASSEWGSRTAADYRAWATATMKIDTVILAGRHRHFRKVGMEPIEDEILAFLADRAPPISNPQ